MSAAREETPTARRQPYQGLIPYMEEDASFFFGRDVEVDLIIANLTAIRLTLFYGPSGVGKSSVLRAGVAHRLREEAVRNLAAGNPPDAVAIVFANWREDPIEGLLRCTRATVEKLYGAGASSLPAASASLADTLRNWAVHLDTEFFILLDQFEEYFLYQHRVDADGRFADELITAIGRSDQQTNFLISIREDALSSLDRFKGRVPNLFSNYLRIDYLDRKAARAAIERPLEEYNRRLPAGAPRVSIEPALVETVLSQLRPGAVSLTGKGRGGLEAESSERIETPYLQLVMTYLWDAEQQADSAMLRFGTLQRLGGARRLVETHLDRVMNTLSGRERKVASRVFHYLVTPSGRKIAYTPVEVASSARVSVREVSRVLEKLSGRDMRVMRPVSSRSGETQFEIFHDEMAQACFDWGRHHSTALRTRKILAMSAIGIVGLVAFALFVLVIVAGVYMAGRQQTEERFADTMEKILSGHGLEKIDSSEGELWSGGVRNRPIQLKRGVRYMIVGVCDLECTDLDVSVLWGEQVVISEHDKNFAPTVEFTVREDGEYTLRTRMVECSTAPCAYQTQVYSDPASSSERVSGQGQRRPSR